jgi:hypothetical protein
MDVPMFLLRWTYATQIPVDNIHFLKVLKTDNDIGELGILS